MHYSYLLLKPDGLKYLNEISNIIESEFQSVRYFAVDDFKDIIKKLYYKHYQQGGEKFSKSLDSYLYGLTELFGNESILILVGNKTKTYEETMKTTFNTKQNIRRKFANDDVGVITNHGDESNYIKLLSPEGEEKKLRIMNDLGSYRISNLNIIHCPDPTLEDNLNELKILCNEGIISDENLIPFSMIDKMKKYQTHAYMRYRDDMNCEGQEPQTGMAGWIEKEIEQIL